MTKNARYPTTRAALMEDLRRPDMKDRLRRHELPDPREMTDEQLAAATWVFCGLKVHVVDLHHGGKRWWVS